MKNKTPYKTVLAIAGSDSGGCAGIQADIKSISTNGAFATSVITAITAQNTVGVSHIFPIPAEEVKNQIIAVLSDIDVNVVKIGMLYSSEIIETVTKALNNFNVHTIVLDPVMVATSGDRLIDEKALETLKSMLPKTTLITPNIPEAQILLGVKEIKKEQMPKMAKQLGITYKTSVLLKGGHIENQNTVTDFLYLFDTDKLISIPNTFIHTNNTRGTGCSLSSAIATHIALGCTLENAVLKGVLYVHNAIKSGKDKVLGKGNGPIYHF